MITEINVLDLRRGDTIVIVAGTGRHRGGSEDNGCIDVTATESFTAGDKLHVLIEGTGDKSNHFVVSQVSASTDLVVLR